MTWRCVVFCPLLIAGASTLISPVALAAGPALTWAAPVLIDHQPPFPGDFLAGVSCPSSGLCVAVDKSSGNMLTSTNPTGGVAAWTLTHVVAYGPGGGGLSCPSSGLCVAGDGHGDLVTSTNPTGGAAAWTVTKVDGTNFLGGVSCPSSSLCV